MKVYHDTSVLSALFDARNPERQELTKEFFSRIHEHEVFIVEGEAVFICDGKEHRLGREDVVFVPGGSEHQFRNTSDSVLRFLCIIPASAS